MQSLCEIHLKESHMHPYGRSELLVSQELQHCDFASSRMARTESSHFVRMTQRFTALASIMPFRDSWNTKVRT
jgi:hypothetical protein